MHILIMGGRGQLGQAMQSACNNKPHYRLSLWNRPHYDIINPIISEQIARLRPDLVVNTAAWTDVDGAEAAPDAAYAANMLGPQYVAQGCAACGARLVHISTNEVFEGQPGRSYREYDQPAPNGIYAQSKLAGERAVEQTVQERFIVRVAWLYGAGGNNFPHKIIRAADKHGALRVVDDEFGNPTAALDVAEALSRLVETGRYGTYHLVNQGHTSRFELAKAILQQSGRGHIPLTPIPASEWPRATTPPPHAVLINQAAAALGIELRPWQEALMAYLQRERCQSQKG